MARPKIIKYEIDTQHFSKVDPFWRWPLKSKFLDDAWDKEIRNAVCKLAEWDPQITGWTIESWAKHEDGVFWRTRDMLISVTIAWISYDWDSYDQEFELQKSRERQIIALIQNLEAVENGLLDVNALLSSPVFSEELLRAQAEMIENLRREIALPRWTGAIEWNKLPYRALNRNTIVASILAAMILLMRDRSLALQRINYPIAPLPLGKKIVLPWPAIASFTACSLKSREPFDAASLSVNVKNVWPRIRRFYSP